MRTSLLFIGGFPSSGTDLVKLICNSHPRVALAGELPFLAQTLRRFGPRLRRDHVDRLMSDLRASDVYHALPSPGERQAGSIGSGREMAADEVVAHLLTPGDVRDVFRYVGSKTPQFTEQLDVLADRLPSARFVIVVRDVRDVALSWSRKWGKSPVGCSDKWRRRMACGLRVSGRLGDERVLWVRYEDLLSDPERVCRRLCRFLELSFDPAMLAYHENVVEVVDGKRNYGQPLLRRNQRKWLTGLTPHMIRRVEQVAWPVMVELGYQPRLARGPLPLRRLERMLSKLGDLWALLVVGNRELHGGGVAYRCKQVGVALRKRMSGTT